MSNQLYSLIADYGTGPVSAIYSTQVHALRMFGKDHHKGANLRPSLTLRAPDGTTIATMDEWATDWTEANQ